MPQYERCLLQHYIDKALEGAIFVSETEIELTQEEITQLIELRSLLQVCAEKYSEFVTSVEQHKRNKEAFQIKRTYNGPIFQWEEHEKRIKQKKNINKIQALKSEISRLEKKLGEIP